MVIWVHNICYARFVFNKFSFQKKQDHVYNALNTVFNK